jgi:hypothetical protein
MYSAFANTFIVLSIGILMAHAMEPFARAPSNRRRKRALTTASQAVRTAPSGGARSRQPLEEVTHRNWRRPVPGAKSLPGAPVIVPS